MSAEGARGKLPLQAIFSSFRPLENWKNSACEGTQAVLAVPEIEYKQVLACISRPPKTNKSVETCTDEKILKNFCK